MTDINKFIYAFLDYPETHPNDFYRFTKNSYGSIGVEICLMVDDWYVSIRNTSLLTERGLSKLEPSNIYCEYPASSHFTSAKTINNNFKKYIKNAGNDFDGKLLNIAKREDVTTTQFIKDTALKFEEFLRTTFSNGFNFYNETSKEYEIMGVNDLFLPKLTKTFKRSFNKIDKILNPQFTQDYIEYMGSTTFEHVLKYQNESNIMLLNKELRHNLSNKNTQSKVVKV